MTQICVNFVLTSIYQNKKTLFRYLWQQYLDRVIEIRFTYVWKEYYPKKSETVERIFGDAKEKHGMRYT